MNSYRVYVLRNPKGSSYIGFSEDVNVRVEQHNLGMSRSTRGKGPWKIVWQSDRLAFAAARKLERDLKKQKGGNGFIKEPACNDSKGRAPPRRGRPAQPNYLPHRTGCAKFRPLKRAVSKLPA